MTSASREMGNSRILCLSHSLLPMLEIGWKAAHELFHRCIIYVSNSLVLGIDPTKVGMRLVLSEKTEQWERTERWKIYYRMVRDVEFIYLYCFLLVFFGLCMKKRWRKGELKFIELFSFRITNLLLFATLSIVLQVQMATSPG
jgi:hypothetical protein